MNNASALGAYIIFVPDTWNETRCKNITEVNLRQINDVITKDIHVWSNGVYYLNSYVTGSDGLPDRDAVPAVHPSKITIEAGT